jgi:hypothetical protein
MAHKPLKMTIDETHRELRQAWAASYSPERNAEVIQSMNQKPLGPRVFHFITRLVFRAIYFPQTTRRAWIKVIFQNRRTIFGFVKEGLGNMLGSKKGSGDRKLARGSKRDGCRRPGQPAFYTECASLPSNRCRCD